MKIQVTQQDIDNGVKAECETCPIALAAMRASGCKTVEVGRNDIYFVELRLTMELPESAKQFIHAFDLGYLRVAPFEFEIEDL